MSWRALWIIVVAACGQSARPSDEGPCNAGQLRCMGADLFRCEQGAFVHDQTCAGVCNDTLGCVACQPGAGVCLGATSHVCTTDGESFTDTTCNGPGEDCDPDSGRCEAPCSPQQLANGYLGCEYYPTVTGNQVSNKFAFAIIVANYNTQKVKATIDGAGMTPDVFEIAPNSVAVKKLAWQQDLKLCNADHWEDCRYPTRFSARVAGGAYHLVTNRPVAVYQFSPLDYRDPMVDEFSYTNDASLLFPVNVWGTAYRVASWRESTGSPGLMTVVAEKDGTTVTVTPTGSTQGDATVPSFAQGMAQSIVLNRGDAAELGTIATGDLTGTLVSADQPIQVIGGHFCANVPFGTAYCDHLEESMIPIAALSNQYLVTPPASDAFPNGRIEIVRVIATQPNTELTFDPPQMGVNTTLQRAGDFVELASTSAAFQVTATSKILVAQYMIGQTATTGTADPAMTVGVPIGQFRRSYLFHAPINYVTNYVDVTAHTGTHFSLDGAAVTTPATAIGGSGWSVTRLVLDHGPGGDGNHQITGDDSLGITVYGYGDYTSYWYPGGLDLAPIIL